MFSTTIIPTLGRESLTRAVQSVLTQDFTAEDFEVIVVNDSGNSLSFPDWQHSDRVTIINTKSRERSVARNAAAALARGRYLHFLDDDDWLLPGALKELHRLAMTHNAKWIYGTSRLVDGNNTLLTEHHLDLDGNVFTQVVAGEWLPMQSSIIDADLFFEVGGFDWRLIGVEDKDICRKIAHRADFVATRLPIACLTRDRATSTTDYSKTTMRSVLSRDIRFDEPGTFGRMKTSANDAYWRGRLVRAYLTCVVWNLKERSFLRGLSRFFGGVVPGLLTSGRSLLTWSFWRALLWSHTRHNVY